MRLQGIPKRVGHSLWHSEQWMCQFHVCPTILPPNDGATGCAFEAKPARPARPKPGCTVYLTAACGPCFSHRVRSAKRQRSTTNCGFGMFWRVFCAPFEEFLVTFAFLRLKFQGRPHYVWVPPWRLQCLQWSIQLEVVPGSGWYFLSQQCSASNAQIWNLYQLERRYIYQCELPED